MRVLAGVAIAAAGVHAGTITGLTKTAGLDAHRKLAVDKCLDNLRLAMAKNGATAADSLNNFKAAWAKIGIPFFGDGSYGSVVHYNKQEYPAECDAAAAAKGTTLDTDNSMVAASTGQCILRTTTSTETNVFSTSAVVTKTELKAVFGGAGPATADVGTLGVGFATTFDSTTDTNIDSDSTGIVDTVSGTGDVGGGHLAWNFGVKENGATGEFSKAGTIRLQDHGAASAASQKSMFTYETGKVSVKGCDATVIAAARNALHGACESVYAQETTKIGILNISKQLNFLHAGWVAHEYYNAIMNGVGVLGKTSTSGVAVKSYPYLPAASEGTCFAAAKAAAFTDGQVTGSVGVLPPTNSKCEKAMLDIYVANGALTGADASTTKLTTSTMLAALTAANGWYTAYDTGAWGDTAGAGDKYDINFKSYLAPKDAHSMVNAGSDVFEFHKPEIMFDSTMDEAKCTAWVADLVTGSSTIVHAVAALSIPKKTTVTLKESVTDFNGSNAKIIDRIEADTEVVGLVSAAGNTVWSAFAAGPALGSKTVAGGLKAIYDECLLGASGGLIVNPISTNKLPAQKVMHVRLASGKTASADRSVGTSDCPASLRAGLKTIMSEHCFVGSDLVNPTTAGTYYAAFEAALQLRANADDTAVPSSGTAMHKTTEIATALSTTTPAAPGVPAATAFQTYETGLLPQLLALCGYNDPVTCTAGEGKATVGSACADCAAGKFTAAAASAECGSCGKGKYQDEAGKSVCKDCVKGKYGKDEAAVAASKCTACVKGKYGDAAALTGEVACKACGTGKNTTAAGATVLANCTAPVDSTGSTTKASGALSRFSALAITSLLALIAM